jgi:fluoride exporter
MNMILAIAAGGAIGSVLRHLCGKAALMIMGANFPYGTLFVNVTGSLVMGVFVGWFSYHNVAISQEWRAFLTVGILGGFTTFSAFSLDAILLYERGEAISAVSYVLLSLFLSLAAVVCGLYITRSLLS